MRLRWVLFLLALVAAAHSTAPAWVASGVNLTYSQGSTTNTYVVTSRTNTDIIYKLTTVSNTGTRSPTLDGNASVDFGDFWFDISLLSGQHTGDSVGDYHISDESSQAYAGKTYDTISVQTTVQGATVTRVLDKASGLVLKVSVNVQGVQDVTLAQRYIPAFDATAPQQPPSQPSQNASNPAPPANQTAPPQANNTQPENQTPPTQQQGTPYQPSSGGQPITGVQPYSTKSPFCCSSAFILALLGFAAARQHS